ncbi:MAG: DUF1549 domain-containing protein [Verrucomicrobiota bacterium]
MKNPLFFLPVICLLAIQLVIPGSSEARIWTSTEGEKLEAVFEALDGEMIQLRLRNGKSVKFPVSRLIPADLEAAERFALVGDDAMTMASAKKIDYLLARNLSKSSDIRSFNERLPDDLFVRRIYLDIIGRIPTREEFQAFADSAKEDKRAILIDELLASPGRASHLFNYFADMYRIKDNGVARELDYSPYSQWWRDSLNANVGYGKMVHQMITAKGNLGHNPAIGFLQRDEGMEFDAFSNFGQVMMGIDVSCAQCHDHPFEDWTMQDFYGMAAFFGNTQRSMGSYRVAGNKSARVGLPGAPADWLKKFENYAVKQGGIDLQDRNERRQFGWYKTALGLNVVDNKQIDIAIPSSIYELGGQVAAPAVLYGENVRMEGKTRRKALADWMVNPSNDRFAVNIANRMWSRAFGRALVEPVIDFPMDWQNYTGQPEVLEYLGQEMVRLNYDLREFMRILYNTQAYQGFSTYDRDVDEGPVYLFQGPVLRRMRAEQAWDSLLTLAYGSKIDLVKGGDGSFMREVLRVDFKKDTMEEVFAKYEAYKKTRNKAQKVLRQTSSLKPTDPNIPVVDGIQMVRSSNMIQPASASSMLSTFGQSDRMVTDNSNFDGTVPQVLALMNGSVTTRLTGSTSQIVEDLSKFDGPDDMVRGVFFTMLSRYPTEVELKKGVDIMETYGEDGIRDLAWALLNTPEFLFIQ